MGFAKLHTPGKLPLQSFAKTMGDMKVPQIFTGPPLQEFKFVGDVRGAGMMVGIDIVESGLSKRQAPAAAKFIREGLKARRVLVSTDGPHNSIIKIKPPLCFGKKEADRLVRELRPVNPLPLPSSTFFYSGDECWTCRKSIP
jgi:adenosylmethionine-8-amino-7-oxononanoate aminotransferase